MGIDGWHGFCFKKFIAPPNRLANMNSNVSPLSFAHDFQRHNKLNPSARLGIDVLAGIGAPGTSSSSFSSSLQQQLRPEPQPQAQAPSAPVRQTEPAVDRPPSPGEQAATAQAEKPRASDDTGGTVQPQSSSSTNDAQPAQPPGSPADANAKDGQGAEVRDAESSVARPGKKAEAADSNLVSTDVPALIAALLPGLQASNAAKPAADSGHADVLAGDSRKKSLQNSGLLPTLLADGRKGSQAGGRQAGAGFAAVLAGNVMPGSSANLAAGTLLSEGKALAAAQAGDADGLHTLTNLGLPHVGQRGAGVGQGGLQLPVATPAGREAWAEDVGNQVRWMLGRAESKAELVLTPPNMGKLEVSITLNGDQTTAQFVASSQAARDALEQALPRLREILQQAGISLGQTNVSTSGEQGAGSEGSRHGARSGRGTETSADTSEGASRSTWLRQHDGMVDTFA